MSKTHNSNQEIAVEMEEKRDKSWNYDKKIKSFRSSLPICRHR
jgi:hypothetical protein